MARLLSILLMSPIFFTCWAHAQSDANVLGSVSARQIVTYVTNSDCWNCTAGDVGGISEWAVRMSLKRLGYGHCPRSMTHTSGDVTLYEYVMQIQNCSHD